MATRPEWSGPRQVLAVLGNAETDVARPFLGRLRAAMEVRGIADVEFAIATARAPDESVDPKELWRLLAERLATPGGGPAPDFGLQPLRLSALLELELRSLAGGRLGGAGVRPDTGYRGRPPAQHRRHQAAGHPAPRGDAGPRRPPGRGDRQHRGHGRARRPTRAADPADPGAATPSRTPDMPMAAFPSPANGSVTPSVPAYASGPGPAEPLNGNGRTAHQPSDHRVTLLTVRFDPDSGTSQVDLAYGTARASGRATAGPLAGGPRPLWPPWRRFGLEVPFYLVSAERAMGILGEPVVVVVAPRRSDGGQAAAPQGRRQLARIGAAEGSEPVEAASRATLAALNRYLTQGKKAPPLDRHPSPLPLRRLIRRPDDRPALRGRTIPRRDPTAGPPTSTAQPRSSPATAWAI